ncbi:hypothetical protein ACHAXS_003573 [Conticribra weissflogii]
MTSSSWRVTLIHSLMNVFSTNAETHSVNQDLAPNGTDIEYQGYPSDYVGVNIKHFKDRFYEFTQQALIEAILDGAVIVKLNYHAQTSRSDIIFAVHQLAEYLTHAQKEHGLAVEYLYVYFNLGSKLGMKFKLDGKKGFECYDNADFSGSFKKISLKMNQHVPNLTLAGASSMTVVQSSAHQKLQIKVAFSTLEAEYISLSNALYVVIPIMQLIEEFKQHVFFLCTLPYVYCKSFEMHLNLPGFQR